MASNEFLVNLIDDTSEEHHLEDYGNHLLRLMYDADHVWYGHRIEGTWFGLGGGRIITAGSYTDTSMGSIVIHKIDLDDTVDHLIVEAPSLDVNAFFGMGMAFAGLGEGIGGSGSPDSALPSILPPIISPRHSAAIERFGEVNGSIPNIAPPKRYVIALNMISAGLGIVIC